MPTRPLRVALVGVNAPGYRSLALGYLRAAAQADERLADVTFTTLDLDTAVDPWWIAYRLLGLGRVPDVVGFSVLCWNARHVYEAVRLIKSVSPETLIVLGGPEVGPVASDVLRRHQHVDVVVMGEGEATLCDLLARCLDAGGQADLTDIPGVVSRKDGELVSGPDRELIENLDSIPSPYLAGVLEPVDGSTYLESYRGCPHRCAYCFEGKGYGRLRRFSDERVAAEIDFVASAHGVHSFSFIDPVFNLTEQRLAWLAEHLRPYARRGARLHTVEVDVERVDGRAAAMLREAGVVSVETGPQSIGLTALQNCRRPFDPERFSSGVHALKDAGICVECDLIVGLPGDTVADVVAGLEFAIALDPGIVQISTLHVLPGTELWQRAGELGVRYDEEPPHEVISTEQLTYTDLRRLEALGVAATAVYRARP